MRAFRSQLSALSLCALCARISSADDADAVTVFHPLMTDTHTQLQPRRTSTTRATTSHQMRGVAATASQHRQVQEPHWALTVRAVGSSWGHHEHPERTDGLHQHDFGLLECVGLAQTQAQPLQVLSSVAVSIGGELGTLAQPIGNLRDRELHDAWTDFRGVHEPLAVGITNFDDQLQGISCDNDENMGSIFTTGGDASTMSRADYDSRGYRRNGFLALLLSGDSGDGDGVIDDGDGGFGDDDGVFDDDDGGFGDGDEVLGDGDGALGDGDEVLGDGDEDWGDSNGVFGDDRDVHSNITGDVEHELHVAQGDGEQGGDDDDEAEEDDEAHADDRSTADGWLSPELEQQIVDAAEKILRQTPRNSIDTWVLYRRLLRYRQLGMLSRAVACALAMQMRDHEKEIFREEVPDVRLISIVCRRRTASTAFGSARCI